VSDAMLDPTWAATKSPLAAPIIASPVRSRTWENFLMRWRMVVTYRHEDIRLGHFAKVCKMLPRRKANGFRLNRL
jgi:hypothetical protein